ncbi:MAG: hypothetical protein HYV26_18345, partial [Candidatus Hydrogenedentes bacterium]|nr:hypothetical protein [Candidatus Hydrogenedentota bacterium]
TRPPPGFERVYPPEAEQAAGALFETVDGPSGWHAAEAGLSGLLPLYELFSTTDGVVAYARCTITAPADGEVRLGLGSNDGARLWVNGELVYSEHGPRGGSPRDEEIVVPLRSGPNTVLAKVENLGQNWKLYLSIHDPARVYQFSR